jgi:hypothetical protein
MSAGQQNRQKYPIPLNVSDGQPTMLNLGGISQCAKALFIKQKFALCDGKNLRPLCGEKAFVP